MSWTPRHDIAAERLHNILRAHTIATARILEQKISDAGPNPQRIDPHILTEARNALVQQGDICELRHDNINWYYLPNTPTRRLHQRLTELAAILTQVPQHHFNRRLGQALEIAVYRALLGQTQLEFFGCFPDLDQHDDSTPYTKEEPPKSLSGRRAPGGKIPDFLVYLPSSGYAAIEVKNVREWFYPDRAEVRELLIKCCALDVVPVLIARRIHYSTFSVLNPCGIVLHQTYNQLYPATASTLAAKAKDKRLLGYHDIRLGNQPDARLIKFIHHNLPQVLPEACRRFNFFKDLLCAYAHDQHNYESFAARVKRRSCGEPEDFPGGEEPDWI